MNREQLKLKVNSILINQIKQRGYIAPIDVFMDLDKLTKDNYTKWRNGQIDYLERVFACNLSQCSFVLDEIHKFALINKLKPSKTVYKGWGKNKNKLLRFSKTNNPFVENKYSTHYFPIKQSQVLCNYDNNQ